MSNSKKSIAVLGIGHFGYQLAVALTQKGFNVLAIDHDAAVIDEIKELVTQAIVLDSSDEKAMRSINIDTIDTAVVAIGSEVESSLITTALLRRMDVSDIHVRYINSLHESILMSMGIQKIFSIEREMGLQFANTLSVENVGRYISISDHHSLMEVQVPKSLVGSALKDLHLRSQYRVNIVGIKTRVPSINDNGEVSYIIAMTDVPDPSYPLSKDDYLVISGTDVHLKRFVKLGEMDV
jgi:trk system potassium uptake protein TrkA